MSPAARHAAPVHDELGFVGKRVFHGVGIEVLVDVVAAIMAAAQGLGLDRPGVLHPAAMVDDVDVEVAEAAAAGPEEAVEASDLVVPPRGCRPACGDDSIDPPGPCMR